jgi:ATP-dependent Clp protease ATP-binding subunit ClpA
MPKINVYLPEDLAEAVRNCGVPVSVVCQRALEQAVRRVAAIREIAAEVSPADSLSATSAVNFTGTAMAVLQYARVSAGSEGSAEIGTGHVLRALLAHGHLAIEVLNALEITPRQVQAALDKRAPSGTCTDGSPVTEPAMSGQVAMAIELAVHESSRLGTSYVGSEHLLLGLIGEPDGVAGSALRSLGARLPVTRCTAAAALAGWAIGISAHQQRTAEHSPAPAQVADQLSAAIRAELEPVLARIDRLEHTSCTKNG